MVLLILKHVDITLHLLIIQKSNKLLLSYVMRSNLDWNTLIVIKTVFMQYKYRIGGGGHVPPLFILVKQSYVAMGLP
jgi:hypothetical protein